MVSPENTETAERRISLLYALLSDQSSRGKSRRTKADLLRSVNRYPADPADADSMFEADKTALRNLGVDIRTEKDVVFDTEYYSVAPGPATPTVQFTSAETLLVRLAVQMWAQSDSSLRAPRTLATLSPVLSSASGEAPRVSFRLRDAGRIATFMRAIARRHSVEFRYSSRTGAEEVRYLQPWLLDRRDDRIYVRGFDTVRSAPRTFRVSRLRSDVALVGDEGAYTIPDDTGPLFSTPPVSPVVVVRSGTHARVLALATHSAPGPDGDTVVSLPARSRTEWERFFLAEGPGIEIVEPQSLGQALQAHWRSLKECHG